MRGENDNLHNLWSDSTPAVHSRINNVRGSLSLQGDVRDGEAMKDKNGTELVDIENASPCPWDGTRPRQDGLDPAIVCCGNPDCPILHVRMHIDMWNGRGERFKPREVDMPDARVSEEASSVDKSADEAFTEWFAKQPDDRVMFGPAEDIARLGWNAACEWQRRVDLQAVEATRQMLIDRDDMDGAYGCTLVERRIKGEGPLPWRKDDTRKGRSDTSSI